MSAREWQPGDVRVAVDEGIVRLFRYYPDVATNPWVLDRDYSRDHGHSNWTEAEVAALRPIVVIDPENDAQLERLAYHLARIGGDWPRDLGAVRMVLNAMIAPPKPAEPMGLGAVVEDVDGERWVQFSSKNGLWWRNYQGWNRRWTEFGPSVKVLSEGIS
jgi:hypothetical protein